MEKFGKYYKRGGWNKRVGRIYWKIQSTCCKENQRNFGSRKVFLGDFFHKIHWKLGYRMGKVYP